MYTMCLLFFLAILPYRPLKQRTTLMHCDVKTIYASPRHTGDTHQLDCSNNSSTARHKAFFILHVSCTVLRKSWALDFVGVFRI